MEMKLRLPDINGVTDREQLLQIKSYLYQLARELQAAFKSTEEQTVIPLKKETSLSSGEIYNSVKGLIIKSAEIVEAYYEEINSRLKSVYVAESDFGEYREENDLRFKATAEDISLLFSDTQSIKSDLEGINGLISHSGKNTVILSSEAWIKLGAIKVKDSGHYLYGIEIGQTDEKNGVSVDRKFAQYTSEGTYLYDENGISVAQIARGRLVIEEASVKTAFSMGGFVTKVYFDGSLTERWEGASN